MTPLDMLMQIRASSGDTPAVKRNADEPLQLHVLQLMRHGQSPVNLLATLDASEAADAMKSLTPNLTSDERISVLTSASGVSMPSFAE
jgi:hypothetical protein